MVSTDSQTAMDAAKKAVAEFMMKNGHADTTVHERVAPAIYHETISKTEHETITTVVDREQYQDHYHLSIQPVTDNETLEEQHKDNILPTETRTFQHEDHEEVQRRLDAEHAKFRDHIERVDGEHTQTVVPVVTGERIHHHVHEVIQPIVNKHTVEPHIVHTVLHIHEIHHNAAQHHATAALSAVSMAEFKKQGGVLTGREERFDFFEGSPRNVGGSLGTPHGNAATGASQTGTANQTVQSSELHPNAQQDTAASAPSASPAQHGTAPSAPSALSVPQRRSSNPPMTDKILPTPSATAVNEASKIGEGPLAISSASSASAQGGRWNLLPMHLARSAGDAQLGRPPVRASVRPTPAPADGRQASVAKPGQDQQPRRAS